MSKPWKLLFVLVLFCGGLWLGLRPRHAGSAGLERPQPTPARQEPARSDTGRNEPERLESAHDPASDGRISPGARQDAALARVRLRLVDEATHEPVPFLAAALHDKVEVLERLESDAQGRLTSKGEFPPGDYVLDFSSERSAGDLIQTRAKEAKAIASELPLALALADEAAPAADFPLPVGPTYTFVSTWPGGKSPVSFNAQLGGADPRLAFDRLFAPLHEGPPAWARFSPLAQLLGGGPPFLVRVTSEDGLWYAGANVESVAGRAATPLTLVFEARARLVGRVLDPAGKPVAGEWLQAWAPGASFDNPTRRPLLVTTTEDGAFDLRAIEPARYTLKLEGKGFLPFTEEVEVPSLTRVEHDVQLARPDPAQFGPVRGHVTSRSGNYTERLLVLLTPEAPPRNGQTAWVEWSGDTGAKSGTFEFKDLMPGDYTLDLRPGDLAGIEPRKLVVQPAQKTLEFVVQDSGARAELRVHVVSDEDGATLKAFRLSATIQGSDDRTTLVPRSGETDVVLREAPVGATLDLRIEMQGRQMLWTTVVVAEKPEPLVLKLKTGWGAEFTVMGPKLEPLAGAKLFLDDEPAGVADEKGVVRAALPAVPQKCRVEYKDWKLAPGGEVSPETGQFRAWQAWIQVRMEPAK
jgi:hypothetical protein